MKPASPAPAKAKPGSEMPILQTRSLREQVYEFLRAEMNRGGLEIGTFLDLGALAEHLGISRTPLRDALLQLEVEGFVEILPRRGFRLKPLLPTPHRPVRGHKAGHLEPACQACGWFRGTPSPGRSG